MLRAVREIEGWVGSTRGTQRKRESESARARERERVVASQQEQKCYQPCLFKQGSGTRLEPLFGDFRGYCLNIFQVFRVFLLIVCILLKMGQNGLNKKMLIIYTGFVYEAGDFFPEKRPTKNKYPYKTVL